MKNFVLLIIISIFGLLSVRTPVSAEDPSMGEVLVTNTSEHLIVFSYLKDGFSPDVNERLKSGLPITFTYYVELRRKRPLWVNSKIERKVISYRVKYDPLKKEYIIRSEGDKKEEWVTKDYREVQRLVTLLDGLEVADYSLLDEGKKYYLRIKAEIKPLNAPFPLRYVKIFIPFLDQDTSWQESTPFVIKGEK